MEKNSPKIENKEVSNELIQELIARIGKLEDCIKIVKSALPHYQFPI